MLATLVLAALLASLDATVPGAPPSGAAHPPGSLAAAAKPEAPPPEAPGTPAAEVGAAVAAGERKPRSWFAFPMVFWMPETKLGVAASAGVHFRAGRRATDASSAFVVAGYTMQGQGSIDLSTDVWIAGGGLVSGRLRAVHYPDAFYGIGPETTLAQREEMTRRFVDLVASAELPIAGHLRLGPRLNARAEEIRDVTPGGLIDAGGVSGADGFSAVGLGLSATWDSRDRKLWPTRGAFLQGSYLYYPSSIGRNEGFDRGSVEGRLFLPLGRERVLALGTILENGAGETPFTIVSKLGSTRYLRGIREGRYRDRVGWAAQAEIRVPLVDRFAATLFGGFGDVAPGLTSLTARSLKVAGGAGLRFRLTDEGANIRLDVAAADAGAEVYVLLLEAF